MAQIPENINNAVKEYISELSKEIPVQKVILFGSQLMAIIPKTAMLIWLFFRIILKGDPELTE